MSDEQFLFDDFFVPEESQGVEVSILVKGRHVPIRIRPLSVSDQIEAQSAAVTKRMDASGKVVIDNISEARGNSVIMSKGIASWPFTFQDGSAVPITPENCARMIGDAGTQVSSLIMELSGKKADIAPFVSSSASPSDPSQAVESSLPQPDALPGA